MRGGSERFGTGDADIGASATFARAKTMLVRAVLLGEGAKLTATSSRTLTNFLGPARLLVLREKRARTG